MLAYQTAWFKAHYPHEFYAASMCFDMHQSEKLSVFVDDMRRNGVTLAGPDINHSEAEYSVDMTDEGLAVRYGMAGIRNVGEKAMDAIVAEREANGLFTSLEDLFRRSPQGSMNRRQLEGLAAAGALDCLEPNRAKVLANADMLLAVADEAERSRNSGQAALFGGDDHTQQALRLVEAEPWSRAEQMAKERENFGFYFAAHPVEQWRAIANANGSRTFSSLMQSGVSGGGGRMQAAMAAMVEGVQRRKTKRGNDFVMAEFSDPSGQFSASCFEESLVESFQQWARDGTCVLLQVELDAPSPDEPPRVTVRGARPLSEVRESARMELRFEVDRVEAMGELSLLLPTGDSATGEVYATLVLGQRQEPVLRLGSNFMLDSEVAERVALIEGVHRVSLGARRGAAKLRLVA